MRRAHSSPEELLSRDEYATPYVDCIEKCGSHANSRQAVCVQEKDVQIDLSGTFNITRLAIPHLKESPAGVINNMSSVAGRFRYANRSTYSTTKWGIIGFTKGAENRHRLSVVFSLSAAMVIILPPGLSTPHDRCSVSPPTVSNTTSMSLTLSSSGGAHYWARRFREHGTVETSDRRDGAPVDDILATGDRGGALRREEGDQLGDLGRPARTAQRDAAK
jgi:hypothetical protein